MCPAVKPRLSRPGFQPHPLDLDGRRQNGLSRAITSDLRRHARKRKLRGRLQTGILGPAAKDRTKVVPPHPPSRPESPPEAGNTSREIDASRIPGFGRTTWAVLLKRVFLVDALTCPKCDGRMKILALITKADSVRAILDHLGIPSEAPRRHPARPPPQTEPPGRHTDAFYADPPSPES